MSDDKHEGKLTIRPMKPADWPSVAAIYEQGIATGNATFQTEAPTWAEWNDSHLHFARRVAERNDEIIGWTALSPMYSRACYRGVAEISIYIAAAARGMGVGGRLIEETIAASEQNGIWTLCALIFPENAASMALHQKHGFKLIGVREKLGRTPNGV